MQLLWGRSHSLAQPLARAEQAADTAWHGVAQRGVAWHCMVWHGTAPPEHCAAHLPWAAETARQRCCRQWHLWLLLVSARPGAPSRPRRVITFHRGCQGLLPRHAASLFPIHCCGQHMLAQNVNPAGFARNGKAQGLFQSKVCG